MGLLNWLFGRKSNTEDIDDNKEQNEADKSDVKPTEKTRKYHVSLNKDSKSEYYKMWRVRKEHSEKTIKYFKTQQEALAYAENLAEQSKSSVVIHKVDGSIRKQDYSKK